METHEMPDELKYPLAEVKKVVHKWLYLEDDIIIDIMLSAHIANSFDTDPLWMVFIAPPSSTKTELLRAFEGYKNAYFLSNLNPTTLVSGLPPRKGQPDPSLLLKLDGKTLILKDFTTIISMRSENQKEILAQLREIYDGRYDKAFGNGKEIKWRGKVGLLAACTPIYDQHYGVIGTLGDRFLLYRSNANNTKEMGYQAQRVVGKEEIMRQEIRIAFHTFLDQFNDLTDAHFEKDSAVNEMIVVLACACAICRCPVDRDYRDRSINYVPQAEGPARLTKQFMQLGMALALVYGKSIIDQDVYRILRDVGYNLIPAQRIKILRYLWKEKIVGYFSNWLRTKEIAVATHMPTNTAKLRLEDLMIVGVLSRQTTGENDTAAYEWQINENATEIFDDSHFFDDNFSLTQKIQ